MWANEKERGRSTMTRPAQLHVREIVSIRSCVVNHFRHFDSLQSMPSVLRPLSMASRRPQNVSEDVKA